MNTPIYLIEDLKGRLRNALQNVYPEDEADAAFLLGDDWAAVSTTDIERILALLDRLPNEATAATFSAPGQPSVASTGLRRFHLERSVDVSGPSGTGKIAEGCEFSNGWCALTWLTPLTSVAYYHSIKTLQGIHGHDGATVVVWEDA